MAEYNFSEKRASGRFSQEELSFVGKTFKFLQAGHKPEVAPIFGALYILEQQSENIEDALTPDKINYVADIMTSVLNRCRTASVHGNMTRSINTVKSLTENPQIKEKITALYQEAKQYLG